MGIRCYCTVSKSIGKFKELNLDLYALERIVRVLGTVELLGHVNRYSMNCDKPFLAYLSPRRDVMST